jgi:hypothetical protein
MVLQNKKKKKYYFKSDLDKTRYNIFKSEIITKKRKRSILYMKPHITGRRDYWYQKIRQRSQYFKRKSPNTIWLKRT